MRCAQSMGRPFSQAAGHYVLRQSLEAEKGAFEDAVSVETGTTVFEWETAFVTTPTVIKIYSWLAVLHSPHLQDPAIQT